MVAVASPGHAFLDYLFGGSQTRDAIDNSAVGDLRAWWSGNPVYQFNPYYRGSADPAQQAGAMQGDQGQGYGQMAAPQGSYQPEPQASVTYFPPQSQQQYGYSGYTPGTQQYGANQPVQYQQQPQYYQQPAAQYQPPAPQYQQQYGYPQPAPQYSYQPQAPQSYQQQPQQYQAAPQAYQQQYPGGYGQ